MTSGYELEFFGVNLKDLSIKYNIPLTLKSKAIMYDVFNLKHDFDNNNHLTVGELISPIYNSKKEQLNDLQEKLFVLKENGAYIPKDSNSVGFHIHMGKKFLKQSDFYRILFKLLFAFQAEIKDIARGEHQLLRNNFYYSSNPLEYEMVLLVLEDLNNLNYYKNKSNCLRFTEETVEFRYFNSSLEYKTLEKFLDFVWRLCNFIEACQWDIEQIDYYFEHWYAIGLNPKKERENVLSRLLDFEY